jgi:predicted rRNA methylase YqxC with S4 and FtsJ domains
MLMQSVNLTDDQLWQAIAQNTNAMTALIHQQLELDPAVNTPNGIIRQAKLRESNTERVAKLERNYREYTAELSRRYSLE